jgi:hypothetical protein
MSAPLWRAAFTLLTPVDELSKQLRRCAGLEFLYAGRDFDVSAQTRSRYSGAVFGIAGRSICFRCS